MKKGSIALIVAMLASAHVHADEAVCGTLEGVSTPSFALREAEPVTFKSGGNSVRGMLHVYKDDSVYRVYWQPEGRADSYVLANAGENSVRLVATPPRGSKIDAGPGTLPQQNVLSCPAL